MSIERVKDTHCQVCRKQMTIMKRCTRCKDVIYCSRECQVNDWPQHQIVCGTELVSGSNTRPAANKIQNQSTYQRNDSSIFFDETRDKTSSPIHPPLVDFSKAVKKTNNAVVKPEGKFYLSSNEFHTDVPEVTDTEPTSAIVVRCNKQKHKLCVQNSWSGEEVYKFLSHALTIPLEKLKLIHKGKVLSKDTVSDTIKDKALYQVIGELAEPDDNVDQRDISVMMKQMGIDRNAAIQRLKKKGDLLDALLD